MTYQEFNKFCRALAATTYVVQWGGSHVWKVGGKVFAIGGWQDDEASFTFKVSDIAYENAQGAAGLASRALSCLTRHEMDPAFRQTWSD
jgi:predicted DNA-binding protein (MmcQ/YjbR family)